MRFLIIEDITDLRDNITDFLEARGHQVESAGDGVTGLHLAAKYDYDAIILDIMLPGMSGLDVCSRLREDARKSTPVLMLTARDTLNDKLAGFNMGADDYMVKPFAMEELLARLNVIAQRERKETSSQILRVGDLRFDLDMMQVTRAGIPIVLTPICLRILELLMREAPHVVRRGAVEKTIWPNERPDSDSLRTHIHLLRAGIDASFDKPMLRTLRGIGFRLVSDDEA